MTSIPSNEIIPLNQLSFHKTVLFYLKTNAEPRLSLKHMQISPYFCFKEFPYMVVKDFFYENGEWKYLQLGQFNDICKTLDFDNLIKPLWITNSFVFDDYIYDADFISHLLLKTAVCDVKKLNITAQHLKMNEFKFLISSNAIEDFSFWHTEVVDDDGSNVPVDKIVKLLPNLKEFEWACTDESPEFTPASTAKLIKYLNSSKLTRFKLRDVPETFDFKLFAEFMDKKPVIYFRLSFNHLSTEYTKMLQDYVAKLIETGEYRNRRFLIYFPQQNNEYHNILFKHCCGI